MAAGRAVPPEQAMQVAIHSACILLASAGWPALVAPSTCSVAVKTGLHQLRLMQRLAVLMTVTGASVDACGSLQALHPCNDSRNMYMSIDGLAKQ